MEGEESKNKYTKPVPGENSPSLTQIKMMIKECQDRGKRKYEMIIKVGWNLAVRINELSHLKVEDFDFVEDTVRIDKKYAKMAEDTVSIVMNEPDFVFDLQDYIKEMRLEQEDWLFCHGDNRQNYSNRRLTTIIRQIGEWIGFERMRPHLLRHSRAKWLIMNHYDLRFAQLLLRHKKASTTLQEYARYNLDDLKEIGRKGKKAGWEELK